jgi:hypothetical protein
MSFLKGLFGKKSEVKGELGYFGLGDWWLSTFTEESPIQTLLSPAATTETIKNRGQRQSDGMAFLISPSYRLRHRVAPVF